MPQVRLIAISIRLTNDLSGDVQDHAGLEKPPVTWRVRPEMFFLRCACGIREAEMVQKRGLAGCSFSQHKEPGQLIAGMSAADRGLQSLPRLDKGLPEL